MKISFILPVYNEEATIEKVIARVLRLPLEKEIIIVNDGSTDRTAEILYRFKDKIKIVNFNKNRGRGIAIIMGLESARGDIIAFLDADLEVVPEEYLKLIELVAQGKTEVAIGSRFLGSDYKKMSFFQEYGNRLITIAANLVFGAKFTDVQSGTIVFKKEVIKGMSLTSRRWDLCIETAAKISKRKIKIKELPIQYSPRTKEEGKKLGWKAGVLAFYYIFKYRILS